jgi:hypothetical protein
MAFIFYKIGANYWHLFYKNGSYFWQNGKYLGKWQEFKKVSNIIILHQTIYFI